MTDREKVIRAIDGCINIDDYCNDCDYDGCVFHHGSCEKDLLADALALLKEQEPKIGHWILDPDGMDWNIPAWICSECGGRHNGLPIMGELNEANIYRFAGSQFCPNCGAKMEKQKVKADG